MILSFKTQINGHPTHFVEKIQKGLRDILNVGIDPRIHYPNDYNFLVKDKCRAKIHTIREDKADRWHPGVMIDFFINARSKDVFRFAPRVPVVSTQQIEIRHHTESFLGRPLRSCMYVFIDGKRLEDEQIELLAANDGFQDGWDFFAYFNTDFKGKIIHWTNFRYEQYRN